MLTVDFLDYKSISSSVVQLTVHALILVKAHPLPTPFHKGMEVIYQTKCHLVSLYSYKQI